MHVIYIFHLEQRLNEALMLAVQRRSVRQCWWRRLSRRLGLEQCVLRAEHLNDQLLLLRIQSSWCPCVAGSAGEQYSWSGCWQLISRPWPGKAE